MKSQLLSLSFLFLFIFFFSSSTQAQSEESKKDSSAVTVTGVAIGDISEESEALGLRLLKLKTTLVQSERIIEIDSIVEASAPEILILIDSNFLKREDVTLRDLKVRKVEWGNYKTVLYEYQGIVKNRSEDLSFIINDLFNEIMKWELTKKELEGQFESKDISDGFDENIEVLKETMRLAQSRSDKVFITQKKITDLVLIIDEEIANIELAELKRQKDYFVFDNEPIWKSDFSEDEARDSVSVVRNSTNLIVIGLKQNREQFWSFYRLNIKTAIFQFGFLIVFLVLLIVANFKWKKRVLSIKTRLEEEAKIVLAHPILTTLSLGVLISAFFYESMVPAYAELHVLIVLFGSILLLPKLTTQKTIPFLWLVFLVYIINTFEAFIGLKSNLVRWLLIFDAMMLVYALHLGRSLMFENKERFLQIFRVARFVSVLYTILLFFSIFANIIGMVALSNFLSKAILVSMTFGIVTFLCVKVVTSLFVLIFKLRKASNIRTLTSMVDATHKRIQPLLNVVGFFFWLYFTLNGFELYTFILEWFDNLMSIEWVLGEMTISLGGVLAFVGIFIFSLVLAKMAAALFQDEWMVEVLPRGVAPAISLVLRIVVITLGLYAGFSAAGVDLSKLGFILGALGVGIGFGLQNVVLNFVSGLILAFERPINLGDAIEVDMEKGVVTNIGVRSSNIRTYSGAEVIVPNGDLISKKVINYTLSNRNRRSKIAMKTAPDADPEKVIELFNNIAKAHPNISTEPAPKTYFYGYGPEGNLNFALLYWTTFSDTLKTDSEIALKIFKKLKEENIQAPAPVRRIISKD
jgi:small-conductance mechanosensitive channel